MKISFTIIFSQRMSVCTDPRKVINEQAHKLIGIGQTCSDIT
jgi:hypothetical protein